MDLVGRTGRAVVMVGRVHVRCAHAYENVTGFIRGHECAIVPIIVATGGQAFGGAGVLVEARIRRNIVRIERVSLSSAGASAEAPDRILGHSRTNGHMAPTDVARVLVLWIAGHDIVAGRMESERTAIVCVRYGTAVLVHGRACGARVQCPHQVLYARVFRYGIRAASLAATCVHGREGQLLDMGARITLY